MIDVLEKSGINCLLPSRLCQEAVILLFSSFLLYEDDYRGIGCKLFWCFSESIGDISIDNAIVKSMKAGAGSILAQQNKMWESS